MDELLVIWYVACVCVCFVIYFECDACVQSECMKLCVCLMSMCVKRILSGCMNVYYVCMGVVIVCMYVCSSYHDSMCGSDI